MGCENNQKWLQTNEPSLRKKTNKVKVKVAKNLDSNQFKSFK